MEQLYAPWRGEYTNSTARSKNEDTTDKECVFCTQFAQNNDKKNHIIKRFKYNTVMLNRFPYNAGHLLILPNKHIAELNALSRDARCEIMDITSASIEALKNTIKPHGFNVGLNLGKAAGAGIPSHLHMHVLPRWNGDTNFLPTIAQTKAISFDLDKLYMQLATAFESISL